MEDVDADDPPARGKKDKYSILMEGLEGGSINEREINITSADEKGISKNMKHKTGRSIQHEMDDYDSVKIKLADSDDDEDGEMQSIYNVNNPHKKKANVNRGQKTKPPPGVIKKAKMDARETILDSMPPPPGRIKRAIKQASST